MKSPNEAPYEQGKDFSVVISFDDSATAERVCDVLQLLGRNLKKEEGRLFHQWWNIETLAFTALRELAAVEAAMADMIIIGIHEGRELPEMVAVWMKRLLDLRKDRPGALVAMLLDSDPKTPDTSQGIVSQLKQAASLGQMDFFATRAKVGKDAGVARKASEAARQFVMARKNGAQQGLPGEGRVPAQTCGT
ncbi:MAG: hypothetical protein PHY43_10270 [Verrucomicrobiales bacterium]|nr:hypothetical protein [Verrucomicrobiales bacterium]